MAAHNWLSLNYDVRSAFDGGGGAAAGSGLEKESWRRALMDSRYTWGIDEWDMYVVFELSRI